MFHTMTRTLGSLLSALVLALTATTVAVAQPEVPDIGPRPDANSDAQPPNTVQPQVTADPTTPPTEQGEQQEAAAEDTSGFPIVGVIVLVVGILLVGGAIAFILRLLLTKKATKK